MTVTILDIDPNTTPVQVALERPDQEGLDRSGRLDGGGWGVTASGTAYFDTQAATGGEAAALAYDGAVGRWFLQQSSDSGSPAPFGDILALDPNTAPVQAELARMDGDSIHTNGRLDAGHFGLTSGGTAYFDSGGSTAGETAALGYDSSLGCFFIDTQPTSDATILHLLFRPPGEKHDGTGFHVMARPSQREPTDLERLHALGVPGKPVFRWQPNGRISGTTAPGQPAMPWQPTGVTEANCVGRPRWE